jgi:hypothetical protein
VSALVGHGTTSGTDPGMKVSHQKGVLDNIREHKYNIVVEPLSLTKIRTKDFSIPSNNNVSLLVSKSINWENFPSYLEVAPSSLSS